MRRKLTTLAIPVALAAVLAAVPAAAEICAVDPVPAATLLLPYFEVELDAPFGLTTLLSINSASDQPVVARVTLWTDMGVPTFAFDVYLTGFDVQSLNLRDSFNGLLPVTGPGLSPLGRFSARSDPPPGCFQEIAVTVPTEHLRAAHTGAPSPLLGGLCAGRDLGDGRARGYVTVDVVGECFSGLFPSDPGYFADDTGPGVARHDNVLWGELFFVDPGQDFAHSENLVRLESSPAAFGPGDRTFYGRYLGYSGADGREPLPTAWAARYLQGGGFSASTEFVVWRAAPGPPTAFPCDGAPEWYPLETAQLLSFDEEENSLDFRELVFIVPPEPIAGIATQRNPQFMVAPFGWNYLDFGVSPRSPGQAWVAPMISAEGRYSVGHTATPLTAACTPGGCSVGEEEPVFEVCVYGSHFGDLTLDPGDPVTVRVGAGNCFSRSCTFVHRAACAVSAGAPGELTAEALFCTDRIEGAACLAVCDLSVAATCASPGLAAGSYQLAVGDLTVSFEVPSTVPPGGVCVSR